MHNISVGMSAAPSTCYQTVSEKSYRMQRALAAHSSRCHPFSYEEDEFGNAAIVGSTLTHQSLAVRFRWCDRRVAAATFGACPG